MSEGSVLDGQWMEEAACNPYQTPEAELASEVAGQWMIKDRRLLFRHDAVLPEVDLFTGRTDVPLLAASKVFEVAIGGRSAWLYVGIMALAVTAVAVRRALDLNLILAIFGLIVLSYLIGQLLKRNLVTAVLHYHFSEDAGSRWHWRILLQMALAVAGISFFIGTVFTDSIVMMTWGFGVMCLCLVLLVVLRLVPGGLKCVGESDGWFVLEGVPAAGLHVLELLQPLVETKCTDE